jgi:hypothetical protein
MGKVFLVFGPESSGNHLTSLLLQKMGCYWEEPQKLNIDSFLRGECELKDITDSSNIVLRRSIPYEREWFDPKPVGLKFLDLGYRMYTVILQREWMATMLSNYYHRSLTVEEAWDTLVKAELHIAEYLNILNPFYILNTSALMKDPEPCIKGLELFTGLKWPEGVSYDKYVYDSDVGRHQLLLDHGFNSIDRVEHKKYITRPKPLVRRYRK